MGALTELPSGALAAAWQGSPAEGEGNTNQTLYWAESHNNGLSWGPARILVHSQRAATDGVTLPNWGPVLHRQEQTIHLFYSASRDECRRLHPAPEKVGALRWTAGGDLFHMMSLDSGATWTAPQVFYPFEAEGGIAKVLANPLAVAPITFADNASVERWLLPFWHENNLAKAGPACNAQPHLHGVPGVLASSDQGQTWQHLGNIVKADGTPDTWLIENTIAAFAAAGPDRPPRLLQMFRTAQGLPIYSATSDDGGGTWSQAIPTHLIQPNSKAHLVALPDGTLLLAYNAADKRRTPLVLAASTDGVQWKQVAVIEDHAAGTFAYPTIYVLAASGRVLVIYTVKHKPGAWRKHVHSLGLPDEQEVARAAAAVPPTGMRLYSTSIDHLLHAFRTRRRLARAR